MKLDTTMADKILGYATSNSGNSWRRAYDTDPLSPGETWSETEPTPTPEFVAAKAAAETRKSLARSNAKAVTALKTVTAASVAEYIENNGGNVVALRARVIELAQLVIAIRDVLWSDLPESNGQALK